MPTANLLSSNFSSAALSVHFELVRDNLLLLCWVCMFGCAGG